MSELERTTMQDLTAREWSRMQEEIVRLRGHLQYFCERVEKGEIQSRVTYRRFKDELERKH